MSYVCAKEIIVQYLGIQPDECTEDTYVDQLEALIEKANAYMREGKELFVDAIYDTCIEYLRVLNPDSPVLHQVWSGDDETVGFDEDVDKYLAQYPMLSIQTIKDIDDQVVTNFINKLPVSDTAVNCSLKENGHGIRICVSYGVICKATSRGRSTNGRDLTRQVQLMLGDELKGLSEYPLVELRGEVLLPFSNLDKAKTFNPDIKSAFSGVASMLRDSASEEETKLLKFVCYDVLADELQFDSLTAKFRFIENEIGLETPLFTTIAVNRNNFKEQVNAVLAQMAAFMDNINYDYYTDGVVVAIDSVDLFQSFGSEDKFRLGNLAFKIGRWEQNVYCGRVVKIVWKPGKSKLSPVCVVTDPDGDDGDGVMTGTGNRVRNVPMYAPCHLLTLSAYPGNLVYFKYGGEAGVVPCTDNGVLVTDKAAMKMGKISVTAEDADDIGEDIEEDFFDNDLEEDYFEEDYDY